MGPGFCSELVLLRAGDAAMTSLVAFTVLVAAGRPRAAGRAGRLEAQRRAGACARGGVETGAGTTRSMVVLHTGLLVGALVEVWVADRPFLPRARLADARARARRRRRCAGGASRRSGRSWNTRVIVVPGPAAGAPRPLPLLPPPQLRRRRGRGRRAAAGAHRLDHRAGLHRAQRRAARRAHPGRERRAAHRCPAAAVDASTCSSSAAGPVGLATALYAARAGLDVVVSSRAPAPVDKACGEGLMPGAVARARRPRRRPARARPRRHPLPRRRRARRERRFRAGPGRGRAAHDAARARCASAVAAAGRRRSSGARSARSPGRGDRVLGRRRAGPATCVAADGLHSPVRRLLGLDAPGAGARARYGLRRALRASRRGPTRRGALGAARARPT